MTRHPPEVAQPTEPKHPPGRPWQAKAETADADGDDADADEEDEVGPTPDWSDDDPLWSAADWKKWEDGQWLSGGADTEMDMEPSETAGSAYDEIKRGTAGARDQSDIRYREPAQKPAPKKAAAKSTAAAKSATAAKSASQKVVLSAPSLFAPENAVKLDAVKAGWDDRKLKPKDEPLSESEEGASEFADECRRAEQDGDRIAAEAAGEADKDAAAGSSHTGERASSSDGLSLSREATHELLSVLSSSCDDKFKVGFARGLLCGGMAD